MLNAEHLLSSFQHSSTHLFCCFVLSLVLQHPRQVVHAGQRIWMLNTEHFLPPLQCLSIHLFCCFVLSLVLQYGRQVTLTGVSGCSTPSTFSLAFSARWFISSAASYFP